MKGCVPSFDTMKERFGQKLDLRLRFRCYLPLLVSLTLAGLTALVVLRAGPYGYHGTWLLMTVLTVSVLSILGGDYRIFFTAIGTVLPLVIIFVEVLVHAFRHEKSATPFMGEIFQEFLGYSSFFVIAPIFIAWHITNLVQAKREAVSNSRRPLP